MLSKISIIVPVYNVELYVEECVNSILQQTYDNLEIILVDDGSTDDSGLICDRLKKMDSRVIVIHQDNLGLPEARNSGLKLATGNYIVFIDSDDWIDHRMIETLYNCLVSTNSDISVCNAQSFNRNGMNENSLGRYSNEIIDYSDSNCLDFYHSALDACWNHMFKADLIKNNNIQFVSKDIVSQEDFYFLVKAYTFANRIVTLNDKLYKYRERGSSISKRGQSEDFPTKCLNFVHYAEDYILKNSNRECDSFINYLFVNMLMSSINNVTINNIKSIKKVIILYKNNARFEAALKSNATNSLYPDDSIQHKYYRAVIWLLRHNLINVASILENKRISRLRSNRRTDSYYS